MNFEWGVQNSLIGADVVRVGGNKRGCVHIWLKLNGGFGINGEKMHNIV